MIVQAYCSMQICSENCFFLALVRFTPAQTALDRKVTLFSAWVSSSKNIKLFHVQVCDRLFSCKYVISTRDETFARPDIDDIWKRVRTTSQCSVPEK